MGRRGFSPPGWMHGRRSQHDWHRWEMSTKSFLTPPFQLLASKHAAFPLKRADRDPRTVDRARSQVSLVGKGFREAGVPGDGAGWGSPSGAWKDGRIPET